MKSLCTTQLLFLALISVLSPYPSSLFAQGTSFNYQGRLNDSGGPANGLYDFQFGVYDAVTGGAQQGPVLTTNGVPVTNGLFAVTLDFGAVFPGTGRWLELGARTNGASTFATLNPRERFLPVPYSITAGNVAIGGLPAGLYGSAVTFNNSGNSFTGTFAGNGAALSGVNASTLGGLAASGFWRTSGNSGTSLPADFLGTTDNQPLELRVNANRGVRLEPTANDRIMSNAVNVIEGSPANLAGAGARGVTIGGGGGTLYLGQPSGNMVADNYGTVAGGVNNQVLSNAWEGTIGGGNGNRINADSYRSTIAGGWANGIGTNSNSSFIGGGAQNLVQSNAAFSTISGGWQNSSVGSYAAVGGGSQNVALDPYASIHGGTGNRIISGYGAGSTIGGGSNNLISYTTFFNSFGGSGSTIAGGRFNSVYGDGGTIAGGLSNVVGNLLSLGAPTIAGGTANSAENYGAIGGGFQNTATGSGTVPGGFNNNASGAYSFAAGYQANASQNGSFVWADSQGAPYSSDRPNQVKLRAGGGVMLDVSASAGLNPAAFQINSSSANGVGLYVAQTSSDAGFVVANSGTGDLLKAFNADFGGNPVFEVVNNGTVYSRGVALTSDRNAKENFKPVESVDILNKVAALPISEWSYKAEPSVRHIGPVAQDFRAAFGLNGEDQKHISVVDEGGVALAAIQGLTHKMETELRRKDGEIADLRRQLAELRQLLQGEH